MPQTKKMTALLGAIIALAAFVSFQTTSQARTQPVPVEANNCVGADCFDETIIVEGEEEDDGSSYIPPTSSSNTPTDNGPNGGGGGGTGATTTPTNVTQAVDEADPCKQHADLIKKIEDANAEYLNQLHAQYDTATSSLSETYHDQRWVYNYNDGSPPDEFVRQYGWTRNGWANTTTALDGFYDIRAISLTVVYLNAGTKELYTAENSINSNLKDVALEQKLLKNCRRSRDASLNTRDWPLESVFSPVHSH